MTFKSFIFKWLVKAICFNLRTFCSVREAKSLFTALQSDWPSILSSFSNLNKLKLLSIFWLVMQNIFKFNSNNNHQRCIQPSNLLSSYKCSAAIWSGLRSKNMAPWTTPSPWERGKLVNKDQREGRAHLSHILSKWHRLCLFTTQKQHIVF